MYLSTFLEEGVEDEEQKVIKCIFRLLFITPNNLTNILIQNSHNKDKLENVRYNPNISKYVFLAAYHPPNFTLVSKQLPKPENREGLDTDFLFIESDLFVDYLRITNVFSSVLTLN